MARRDGRVWWIADVFTRMSTIRKEVWADGYTQGELDTAQERYGLRFPPDLAALLLERRPIDGWDWRVDDEGIRSALQHPLNGLLLSLERIALWWPQLGERPSSAKERAEVLTSAVNAAPRLIPIIAHRYIPEEPYQAGNPVLSVMHSDVIYYGANLEEYFTNEFEGRYEISETRYIPFWSEMVHRNS